MTPSSPRDFSTFWAAYVINDPHFAVTYLLFYRRRANAPHEPRAYGDAACALRPVRLRRSRVAHRVVRRRDVAAFRADARSR